MARRRLKLTGFSRFLIFMLFFAPIAYIGIQYYQGEDGLQKAKDLITNVTQDNNTSEREATVPTNNQEEDKITIEDQIQILRTRIEQLEKENEELKQIIKEKDQEILQLRNQ